MMALRLRTNPPLAHRFSTSSKAAAVAQVRKTLPKGALEKFFFGFSGGVEEGGGEEEEDKFQYGSNFSSYDANKSQVSETAQFRGQTAQHILGASQLSSASKGQGKKLYLTCDKLKMEHDKGRDEFEMSRSDCGSSRVQGEVAPPPGTGKLPKVYNPRISCSICRKKGHNKRTCPLRRQQGGNVQQKPVNVQEEGDNVWQQEPLNVCAFGCVPFSLVYAQLLLKGDTDDSMTLTKIYASDTTKGLG
ncbi:hypothetical protein ACLB2K_071369 [Fragaria x ananassa]